MDLKELGTNSAVTPSASDGSTKFSVKSATVQPNRSKPYDMGSNMLGKVEAVARPCAIIGPDRVLPPNLDDTIYPNKMPVETWPPSENIYRRPPDYPAKVSDYQPTRNISPRQTFQENMQRIMVPPTFSSMKSSDESSLKNTKLNMPLQAKYCDVPYNINAVNSDHKSVRNDITMSNVNPSYARNMPPPYDWPASVNIRPLRPYGAPEFYQYPELSSCAGPRPMTMTHPHRPMHEDSAQVFSQRLYQDANIRFKPYPTGKEKHQPRYDYISNYPNTFHPPASIPPHKYDMQKTCHGPAYPVYPPVPFKYLDRRMHDPFVDGYQRPQNQQANFNSFHNQGVPPPYRPIPGNYMQNKTFLDSSSKSMNVNKLQLENNNKIYLNLDSRNKYSMSENLYYNDVNHSQAMRGDILLPTHSALNVHPMPQHSIYRKDNTPLKPYDYNPNYRIYDQSINVSQSHSLQRLPLQFSPNAIAISPSDSNTSNDTALTMGTLQEDCGYVSQSSTASIRSLDSSNMQVPHDIYRRHNYNSYDMVRNTFHPNGPIPIHKSKSNSSKKNLNVRQFLQMWNEGDEEVSDSNKEAVTVNHTKKLSQSEVINNQEQLYVLGLVNVPSEELAKYDHIQKISKLPENIKGYNSIEILNQYEKLLETPRVKNYYKSVDYHPISKSQIDKEITTKLPRPVSPLDVEAKISQSVIHKEVGCNFEIKPCSPQMLNVEVAAPVRNILEERMIEKVINPIIMKSPKFSCGDSNKTQNIVSDVVEISSCKMISDQYSSESLPIKTKTNIYSVQDLENSAGLCLASLPQLDNDIELNFPEINQQFIKANKLETNVSPSLQNLSQVQQTKFLPHENKIDSEQHNLSPQLCLHPVVDKEFSKLSKYRKGRKTDLTTLSKTQKSGDFTSATQRIDSVIIKNPDTNKSHDSESKLDIQKFSGQSVSSLKYESNKYDLPTETAIDFSLSRSEDETAVRYLNEIDRTIGDNLPPLEEMNEENEGGSFTSEIVNVQNASEESIITTTPKVVHEAQGELLLECKVSEENINDKEFIRQVPLISTKVTEEFDREKLTTAELETPTNKNVESTGDVKNIESPAQGGITNISTCAEILFVKDTLQSNCILDIEVENNLFTNKDEEIYFTSSVNSVMDDGKKQHVDICVMGIENEAVLITVPESSLVTETCRNTFENDFDADGEKNKVLEDLCDHSINNLNTKSDINETVENDISENFIARFSDRSHGQIDEIVEDVANISVLNQHCNIILETSDSDNTMEGSIGKYQAVTSEINVNLDVNSINITAVECQGVSDKKKNDSSFLVSREIDFDKNETNVTKIPFEKTECQTELKSLFVLPQHASQTKESTSCDKNDTNDYDKSVVSISSESFSSTKEVEDASAQNTLLTELDTLNNQCLPNNIDANICNVKSKTSSVQDDETESIITSIPSIESRSNIDISSNVEIQETYEINMRIDKCLSTKSDSCVNYLKQSCLLINKTVTENHQEMKVKKHECSQETEINRHIETSAEFITLKEFNKSCLNDITFEQSCLSNKNTSTHEDHTDKYGKCMLETEIDTSETSEIESKIDSLQSDLLPDKSYMTSIKPAEEFALTSNEKKVEENSQVISSECLHSAEIHNSIQKKNEMDIDKYIDDVTESSFITSDGSILENSINESAECEDIIKKKYNNDISAVQLEAKDQGIIDIFGPQIASTTEERKPSSQSNKCYTNTKIKHKIWGKELFSPWIQKLLMYTNDTCKLMINRGNIVPKDNCKSDQNLNEFSSRIDLKSVSKNNKIGYEVCDINNKTEFLNAMHVNYDPLLNEDEKKAFTKINNSSNETCEAISKGDNKILSTVINSSVIRPRKISKRSMSDSALVKYKDNDDTNFVQPCKRKKIMKEQHSALESHMLTEDICNIIQTNRRNSITTFYNEDNVYIVLDNDLILEQDNDDTDKICYSENDEFLAGMETTNCEINLRLETESCIDEPSELCEYSDSLQHIEEKSIEDSWVDDIGCVETVFSEDVAENIIIDIQSSPRNGNSFDLENVDEDSSVFYDSDHIDKIKSIYGLSMCNDNTELIETLYRTPQMNVNKTLYHNESQDPIERLLDTFDESCLESSEHDNYTDNLASDISSYKAIEDKENLLDINQSLSSNQLNENTYPNFDQNPVCKIKDAFTVEQEDNFLINSCESSNDCITSNIPNSRYSGSSSPEVSSTTSEEKSSSILLKITNCNGSRVSQINEVTTDSRNKLSYKLTEDREYQSYSSNFSSSRTLITKAAQKYIPPLKETIYDLKVKLPLPQHRLHMLKQLKITNVKPKLDPAANISTVNKRLKHDICKKPKPKFEDVLKSIDEINFKKHKDNIKKGKISIPKVIIKKNENGAHYASSKYANRKESYNPDLTGLKWQPWVFLEKNNFIDKMILQNKDKAIYCHRKNCYVLLEKFRKYKSVYNANFIISQPKSDTKGNLKYTIRLKHS